MSKICCYFFIFIYFFNIIFLVCFYFDFIVIQDLNIFIMMMFFEVEVGFYEDDREILSVYIEIFVKKQEWKIYEFVYFMLKVLIQEYVNNKFKKFGMYVFCSVVRKLGFFMWNVIVLMVSIFQFELFFFNFCRMFN